MGGNNPQARYLLSMICCTSGKGRGEKIAIINNYSYSYTKLQRQRIQLFFLVRESAREKKNT